MRHARLRMHGALGDFLPPDRRDVAFEVAFELPVGLRDLVQSTGVPHVEVDRVEVDGTPADWPQTIDDGFRVEAYPRYPLALPPPGARFLLDAHLGRLTRYLRLVGVDAEDGTGADDPALTERSLAEGRTLLTRDRALLMRGRLEHGSYVRATDPLAQAIEVVHHFALGGSLRPFTRCMVCNGVLGEVPAADLPAAVLPGSVAARHDTVNRCPRCGRVYWPGSHHPRLLRLIARIAG
jgi:uncharacterized protein with PIN domain